MANQISVTAVIAAVTNASSAQIQQQLQGQFAMAGNLVSSGIANIGTSDTQIPIAALGGGTIGWIALKNLDATNYVTFGADGSHYPIQMNAGEFCAARWNGAAVHGIANTAGVNVQYYIFET
jgi:hypothetical protein